MADFKIRVGSINGDIATVIETGVAGETLGIGDLCYLSTDGKWYKSSSLSSITCSTELRMSIEVLGVNNEGKFLLYGEIFLEGYSLPVGVKYYVGASLGTITDTPKATSNSYQRYIGTSKTTESIVFNPDATYISTNGDEIDGIRLASSSGGGFPTSPFTAVLSGGKTFGTIVNGTEVPAFDDADGFLSFAAQEIIKAYIQTNSSISTSGFSTAAVEVGTTYAPTMTVSFNTGQIRNGDGSVAGPVSGDLASVNIASPSNGSAYSDNSPTGNSSSGLLVGHVMTLANNVWTTSATNAVGTTTYTDNVGGTDPVTSIEDAKADTTPGNKTNTKSGRHYYRVYKGAAGSSPTSSGDIRNLTEKGFMGSSNTVSFSIAVGATDQEVSFYCIRGKSITVIDTGNLSNPIGDSFVRTDVDVDDANGDNTLGQKNTISLGGGGLGNPTNFDVTIY